MYSVVNISCLTIIVILIVLFLVINCLFKSKKKKINKRKVGSEKISILIPARFESDVIASLLDSIKNQSYCLDMSDVYVVIESKTDPTYKICKEYGCVPFIRKNLNLKTKGYALDEVVCDIFLNNKNYNLFYIFDADNILDNDFIKNSLESYYNGYDIAVGYRNCKNGNKNIITAASTLTFSMLNTFINTNNKRKNKNIMITGTGFFVTSDILKKMGGFKMNSLTEDYELTLYSILNNLSSDYNTKAIFYDEQPDKMKITITQRTRWIKGFFTARKKYIKEFWKTLNKGYFSAKISEIFNIKICVVLVITIIVYLINNLVYFIKYLNIQSLINFILMLVIIYLGLVLFTLIMVCHEKELNMSKSMKFKMVFFNPIFLLTFIWCFFKYVFNSKNIGWDRIEHKETKIG